MKILRFERLIRNTIDSWQAWFLRKKLHRKSPTLEAKVRRYNEAVAGHRPNKELWRELRGTMTDLPAGRAVM